jgi:acetoin utilization protein AcuB
MRKLIRRNAAHQCSALRSFCAFVGQSCKHREKLIPIGKHGGGIMKQELVRDSMTREVITISPKTSLAEAHKLMVEKRVRRLPVLDHGQIVGIVTLGDVRGAEPSQASSLSVWEMNDLLAKLKITEIMTRNPTTIQQDASIGEAAQIMLDKKFSGLPVVDESGQLVGIITESDIFRLVADEWKKD